MTEPVIDPLDPLHPLAIRGQVHRALARWYGKQHGYEGDEGGWVYDRKRKVVSHGWLDLYYKRKLKIWKEFWTDAGRANAGPSA